MKHFTKIFSSSSYEEIRPQLCKIIEDVNNKDIKELRTEAIKILKNHRLDSPNDEEEYMISFIRNSHYLTCLLLGRIRQIMSPIDSITPFNKKMDDIFSDDINFLIESSGSEELMKEFKDAGNLFTVIYYFGVILATLYDKDDIKNYPIIYKYNVCINRLTDDIFNGDRRCFMGILQQISIHYGLMEFTILEPLHAGWLHLQENGFHSQEEIGEVMWQTNPNIDKNIWTRMASFLVMEYIRIKKEKTIQ